MQELRDYYYSDGNVVRQTKVNYRPARNLPTREQREQEKRDELLRKQKITDRRNVRELRSNRLLTAYMISAIIVAVFLFVGYVSMQTMVTERMNQIATLESQLATVNADNKAAESRIATTTNLTEIKDKAINELGMVYATSSQIVYYNVGGSDYMSQYRDIPSK
ncbi:MAG: hypothetical protein K5773_02060 [Pseudobutyrivibrio sp.]|nr:hypothetical protein [Pseudobutyrivibrio sp.]